MSDLIKMIYLKFGSLSSAGGSGGSPIDSSESVPKGTKIGLV